MIDSIESERRRAFSVWLRTGRLPVAHGADGRELKFNPWHDPRDGRFTFAGTGKYYAQGWGDGGFTGGGGGRTGGGGATGSWETDDERKQRERTARARAATPAAIANKPVQRATLKPAAPATKPAQRVVPRRPVSAAKPVTRITKTRNGYTFELDSNARTRRVSGHLSMTQTPVRSRSAQLGAGGPDRRPTDEGGHYIAARFNGPTDAFNHFAQDTDFNRRDYRLLEEQWARAKRKGKDVWVKIVPTYEGRSQRPSTINVWFEIDGHKESLGFPNERGKKRDGK